jgi:hypothetical protein
MAKAKKVRKVRKVRKTGAMKSVSGGLSLNPANWFKSKQPTIDKSQISGPTDPKGTSIGAVPPEHTATYGTPVMDHPLFNGAFK